VEWLIIYVYSLFRYKAKQKRRQSTPVSGFIFFLLEVFRTNFNHAKCWHVRIIYESTFNDHLRFFCNQRHDLFSHVHAMFSANSFKTIIYYNEYTSEPTYYMHAFRIIKHIKNDTLINYNILYYRVVLMDVYCLWLVNMYLGISYIK